MRWPLRILPAAVVALLAAASSPAQGPAQKRAAVIPQLAKVPQITTMEVGCEDGVPSGRSLTVASPSRKNRAYLELSAVPKKDEDGKTTECETAWSINISTDNGMTFKRIPVQPSDEESIQGNAFEILGWSADDSTVLAVMVQWAGDYTRNTPVLYDTRRELVKRVDLEKVFEPITPSQCPVLLNPLGFTTTNAIAFSAEATGEDLRPGERTCYPLSRWQSSPPKNRLSRLPRKSVIVRAGTISWIDSPMSLWPIEGEGFNARNSKCALLLNSNVRFFQAGSPYRAEWRRCGKPYSKKNSEHFPQHHLIVLQSKDQTNDQILLTIDNMPAWQSGFYLDDAKVTDLDGDGRQELFVEARYYGRAGGRTWCLLAEREGDLHCLAAPDLATLARKELRPDEDLCCGAWSIHLNADSLIFQHSVYDKKSGATLRILDFKLVLRNERLVLAGDSNSK